MALGGAIKGSKTSTISLSDINIAADYARITRGTNQSHFRQFVNLISNDTDLPVGGHQAWEDLSTSLRQNLVRFQEFSTLQSAPQIPFRA